MVSCFAVIALSVLMFRTIVIDVSATKPNVLRLQTICPVSNRSKFSSCVTAMQMVIDVVNARNDILPDFHVEINFDDGQCSGQVIVRRYFDFLETQLPTNTTKAPLLLGPYCDLGCRYLGSLVHQYGMVDLSYGCTSASTLTLNRKLYPNFYRVRMPDSTGTEAIIQFIKHGGPRWSRFALVTSSADRNDYEGAIQLFRKAQKAALQVIDFQSTVAQFDDDAENERLISSLKLEDARIVVVAVWTTQPVVNFLCATYQYGLRGDRYLFIFSSAAFFMTDNELMAELPTYCDRTMLESQLAMSFWAGPVVAPFEVNHETKKQASVLGYDLPTFEQRFADNFQRRRSSWNIPRDLRLDTTLRHTCHDGAVQAVMALDKANRLLQRNYNLTLKDYGSYPQAIMTAINLSMSQTDFIGVRVGRVKYSERLEMDSEYQHVFQWLPVISQTPFLLSKVLISDYGNVTYFAIRDPIWLTESGRPPRDSILELTVDDNQPVALVFVFGILAVLFSVIQMAIAILTWRRRNGDSELRQLPKSNCLILLGAVVLNFSALVAIIFDRLTSNHLLACHAVRALGTVGTSTVFGTLFFKVTRFFVATWKHKLRRVRGHERFVIGGTFVYVLVNCGIVAIWLSGSVTTAFIISSETVVNETDDVLVTSRLLVCSVERESFFLGIIIALDVLILAMGAYFSLSSRNAKIGPYLTNTPFVRIALLNCLGIVIAVLLIAIVISVRNSRTSVAQVRSAMGSAILSASGFLLISSTTTIVVFSKRISIANNSLTARSSQKTMITNMDRARVSLQIR